MKIHRLHTLFVVMAVCATVSLAGASPAPVQSVKMDVSLSHAALKAGSKQTAYLKVGLSGAVDDGRRAKVPFNLAIVLDKSGSMSGEKIQRAREAALLVVNQLGEDDIVSVITYDSVVRVVVPATKVRDRGEIITRINQIQASGNTALFGGVSKGAEEIRKFLELERVNRMILLSDGLANVGPSSPSDLAKLGRTLAREGIAITTVGLGLDFNEDLMTQLAIASDGNHYFAEQASDVIRAFERDLGAARTIVAQQAEIRIRCARGVRPVRTLGREAEIDGQTVHGVLGQVYNGFERYLLLEVEIPASEVGESKKVADVEVTYETVATGAKDKLTSTVSVAFTEDERVVKDAVEKEVLVEAVTQIAILNNQAAVRLRDRGLKDEALDAARMNAAFLRTQTSELESEPLDALSGYYESLPGMYADDANWTRTRKQAVEQDAQVQYQMHK